MWEFPKIVGFTPQIIHFHRAFPLFSPSNFGVFPTIFGGIGLVGDDSYVASAGGIAVALVVMMLMTMSALIYRSAMGGRKDGFFPIFFKIHGSMFVLKQTGQNLFRIFLSPSRGFKKTCCESTQEVLLKLD